MASGGSELCSDEGGILNERPGSGQRERRPRLS
jgi:hypothetical protein